MALNDEVEVTLRMRLAEMEADRDEWKRRTEEAEAERDAWKKKAEGPEGQAIDSDHQPRGLRPVSRGNVSFEGSCMGSAYGHDIDCGTRGTWFYSDTGDPVDWNNPRACPHCRLKPAEHNGHDPCLATLPGVRNACCGHGKSDGYIQFANGILVTGRFKVDNGPAGTVDHLLESAEGDRRDEGSNDDEDTTDI